MSALSFLADGHRSDLANAQKQLSRSRAAEATAVAARDQAEESCAKLRSQWQGAQRKAAALAAERDMATAHAQKVEALLNTWQGDQVAAAGALVDGSTNAAL